MSRGIQLTEDRYLRAWFSCLNIGVKARNVSGFDESVSKCLVFLYEIVVSLPLGVAGLRMSPDPALRVEDRDLQVSGAHLRGHDISRRDV